MRVGLSIVLFVLLLAVQAGADPAERVTVHLKDGSKLTGELVDFSDGRKYIIAYNGVRQEIDESLVRSLEILADTGVSGAETAGDRSAAGTKATREDTGEPQFEQLSISPRKDAMDAYSAAEDAEAQNQFAGAIELYSAALKADPWFAVARFKLARVLAKADRFAECEQEIEEILKIDPRCVEALRLRHFLYVKTGKTDLQLAAQEELLGTRFSGPELLYRKAHLWLKSGNVERAKALWAKYLAADPGRSGSYNVEAQLLREGKGCLEKGDFDMAIATFLTVERVNAMLREEAQALVIEAQERKIAALREKQRTPGLAPEVEDLGEPQFEEVATSAKEEAVDAYSAAEEAEAQHQFDKAIELYSAAQKTDPWLVAARFKLARVLAKAGRFAECEQEIEEILKIDRHCMEGLELKLFLYVKTGKKDLQLSVREEMLEAQYAGPELVYRKAHLWLKSGNTAKAGALWAEYLAADPSRSGVYNIEARLLREGKGYVEKAEFDTAITRFFDAERVNSMLHEEVCGLVIEAQEKNIADLHEKQNLSGLAQQVDALVRLDPARKESCDAVLRSAVESHARRAIECPDPRALETALGICNQKFDAETAQVIWKEICRKFVAAFTSASSSSKPQFAALLDSIRKFRPAGVPQKDEVLGILAGCYRQVGDECAANHLFSEARGAYEHALLLDASLRGPLVSAIVSTYLAQGELLLADGQLEEAVEVLKTGHDVLPEDEAITDALEEAQFRNALKIAASTRPLAERTRALETFLLKPCSDERRAKGEKELARLQAMLRELKVGVMRDLNKYSPLSTGSEFKYKRGNGTSEVWKILSIVENHESIAATVEISNLVAGFPVTSEHVMTQTESELCIERDGRRDTLLRFPVAVGISWEWREGRVNIKRKYVANNVTVPTQAGEFKNCLKVEMRTRTAFDVESDIPVEVVSYHYFAPGVGLVKVEFPDAALSELGIELVSYSIR